MKHAIWTGSISFGLVNIPIKIFSAVQESNLNLDMLDAKDHSHIKFKRINENTGKEVLYKNIVKAYKLMDEYIVLEPKDFENADLKKTKAIEIINFTNEDEIDSIYYEQPYYLEPDKSGEKAYGLLRDALASSKKVGLASFVLRNKEALAIIKPYGKVIVLNRIRFEEELRATTELKLPPISKTKSREQQMALKLIDQLTEKFDIHNYKDTYSQKLLKIIKEKAKGHPKKARSNNLKVVHTKNNDLISALKASLVNKRKAS